MEGTLERTKAGTKTCNARVSLLSHFFFLHSPRAEYMCMSTVGSRSIHETDTFFKGLIGELKKVAPRPSAAVGQWPQNGDIGALLRRLYPPLEQLLQKTSKPL